MPRLPGDLRKLDWYVSPRARTYLPAEQRGSWDNHLLIAIRLARAVAHLHHLGLCHSDLSSNNCMADACSGRVRLIDLDGLVVPALLPPTVQGTDGYMAPEIVCGGAAPYITTDLHSLAVLIYQLLLFRHPLRGPKYHSEDPVLDDQLSYGKEALYVEHPRDGSNRPRGRYVGSKSLGVAIAHLMEQAFVAGLHSPAERPQAAYWEEQLCRLHDRLLPCVNPACPMKFFVLAENAPLACPWCETAWNSLPSLALLNLFRPASGHQGQYSLDHHLVVGYPGRLLYEWHALPGRSPGPGANPQPLATFQYDAKGRWFLQNSGSQPFIAIPAGEPPRPVPSGEAAPLSDQCRIILGRENEARLAYVQLLPIEVDRRG